jgi:hypothetical protein
LTLDEIRTEIQARGFNHVGTARIEQIVNHAYHDVNARYPWPYLQSTASGTAPLSITDLGHVLSVADTTGDVILPWEDIRSIRERDPGVDGTGNPEVWYQDAPNGQIEVYPVNTTNTISVYYIKADADLSGSNEPEFPDRFHYFLVEGGLAKLYRDSDEWDAANICLQEFERGISTMAAQLLVPNYDSPADIARGPWTSSTDW